MPTAPAKKELHQKHAILRDVFMDNLARGGKSARSVKKPKGSGPSRSRRGSVVFPVIFSFITMLILVSQLNSRTLDTVADEKPKVHHLVVSQIEGEISAPTEVDAVMSPEGLPLGVASASMTPGLPPAVEPHQALPFWGGAWPPEALSGLWADVERPPWNTKGMLWSHSPDTFFNPDLAVRFKEVFGLPLTLRDEEDLKPDDKTSVSLLHNFAGFANNPDISLARLFGLSVKTIVIDPGHGGRDPGAIGPGGLLEKDVTLRIALKLRDRLKRHPGYQILMTRDRDVWVSLKDRVEFANAHQADLFISIHVNALEQEYLNIIETYYFGAPTDKQSLRLAEAENEGSEYLMAEFKGMIKKIGDQFKQQESRALALSIQKSLYRHLKRQDAKILNRGVKTAPFVVLLGADMPSVLAEIACISNPGEEKRLADFSYLNEVASHLEHGIVNYLDDRLSRRILTDGAKQDGKQRADGKG